MSEQQFEPGEEILIRGRITAIGKIGDREELIVDIQTGSVTLDPRLAYKVSTGKNSFWTEASDTQTIDGQCGGCGFVGKVSVHQLCALCGWWSRKTDWTPRATLIVPNDYEEEPRPTYESVAPSGWKPQPSLWQRIKRWWAEQGDW